MNAMELAAWTFVLRFGEALILSAPTVLAGLIMAGLMRGMLGNAGIRALFAGGTRGEPFRAALLGLMTPDCALGVLPIAAEMCRARLSTTAVIVFVLASPCFNPWSFGYAMFELGPSTFLWTIVAKLLLSLAVGWVVSTCSKRPDLVSPIVDRRPQSSVGRIQLSVETCAGHLFGGTGVAMLVAMAGTAVVAAALPAGYFERFLQEPSAVGLVRSVMLLLTVYLNPETGAALASDVIRIGSMPGLACAVILGGSGVTIGTAVWIWTRFGARAAGAAVTACAALTLGATALGNVGIRGLPLGEADTHSFDLLTRPYNFGAGTTGEAILARWSRSAVGGADIALYALGGLLVLGIVLRARSARAGVSATPVDEVREPSLSDQRGPAGIASATLWTATTAFVLLALYGYFPPAEALHARIQQINGDAYDAAVRGSAADLLHCMDRVERNARMLDMARTLRLDFAVDCRSEMIVARAREIRSAVQRGDFSGARELLLAPK